MRQINFKISKETFIKALPAIIVALVFVAGIVYAFTEPTSNPPGGNVSAPLNVSATGQSKAGGLILNTGGAANGLIVDKGNVGIGTANPAYLLTVSDGSLVRTRLGLANTTASNYLNFTAWGSTGGGIFWSGLNSANTTSIEASGLLALMSVSGLVFSGNSNGEAMRISSSNNVGIGTTNPGYKLDVNGAINATSLLVNGVAVGSGSSQWTTSGSNIYYNAGNVGIGVASPVVQLDVKSPMRITDGTGYGYQFTQMNVGDSLKLSYFNTSVNEYKKIATFKYTGDVGIGTESPFDIFHVAKERANNGTDNLAQIIISGSGATNDRLLLGYNTTADNGFIQAVHNALGYTNLLLNPNGGNVGIGTTNPRGRALYIKGGNSGVTPSAYQGLLLESDTHQSILVLGPPNTQQEIAFGGGSESDAYMSWEDGARGNNLYVVNGSEGVYLGVGATSWSALSDVRLKTNIENILSPLEKILNLRPVKYNWKKDPNGQKEVGFIAQEVETYIPEVVNKQNTTDGYLGLSYDRFAPYLVGAIQEQQKQIEDLKAQNKELKDLICLDHANAAVCQK